MYRLTSEINEKLYIIDSIVEGDMGITIMGHDPDADYAPVQSTIYASFHGSKEDMASTPCVI